MRKRPIDAVPLPVSLVLAAALAVQIGWALERGAPAATARPLPAPPSAAMLKVASLGQPEILARALMLWLQSFDYQPGISIAFRELDYAHVEAWLSRMLELDPGFDYPLLAAARLYGEVRDPDRQRRMLAFVAARFDEDPGGRWPWLAHAVYLAKHRLGDLDYALRLARRLADADPAAAIPGWARQMHIFVLEDLGEIESAKVLLGGLLESGEITDPHEQRFLSQRLHDLEQRAGRENHPDAGPAP